MPSRSAASEQTSHRVVEWVQSVSVVQGSSSVTHSPVEDMADHETWPDSSAPMPPPPHRPLPPAKEGSRRGMATAAALPAVASDVAAAAAGAVSSSGLPGLMPQRPVPLERVAIVLHGGAWAIPNDRTDASLVGVRRAALAGHAFLLQPDNPRAALDAVEAAVRTLEDDPAFNAGRGSALDEDGRIEMDASVMEGRFLRYGAVAGLSGCVRNPVTVARAVMERTEHCMLVGSGANRFAMRCAQEGLVEAVRNERAELVTPEALAEWKRYRLFRSAVRDWFGASPAFASGSASATSASGAVPPTATTTAPLTATARARHLSHDGSSWRHDKNAATPLRRSDADAGTFGSVRSDEHDTVGAVAIDNYGNVAAATSTGGITAKMVGRVGDSPLIGCGCYADNSTGAVSTTGHGESIMRVMLASRVCLLMQSGMNAQQAARSALRSMEERVGGRGGVIVIGKHGDLGAAFTTERMVWASISDGVMRSGIDEEMNDSLEGQHSRRPSYSGSSTFGR
ncbi:hypothetical protein CDCA_CDCA01G0343 [Cyanidium caldarium]|uniref:Asparaginase n=1 Tax=Cyanidium caldarium TaxID=2771 RepID=A0AAV9IQU9_CYACA|nr:hypothetical protein CDCA_CDCA01G0343 [Cyanidium caldarium]